MNLEFQSFQKIPRYKRDVCITEKIDGTNAHILVPDDDSPILVGSRTRYITPGKGSDNYGFAEFVHNNNEAFRRLGTGRHYGEWWGCGINRGYSRTFRTFSLFRRMPEDWDQRGIPSNVTFVPTLYEGPWFDGVIEETLAKLISGGSVAAPGYMNPEGIVIFHKASQQLFKITTPNDGAKGQS